MRARVPFAFWIPGELPLPALLLAVLCMSWMPMPQSDWDSEQALYPSDQNDWDSEQGSLEQASYPLDDSYWDDDQDSLEEAIYPWQLDSFETQWYSQDKQDSIPPLRRMNNADWQAATEDLDYQESTRPSPERQASNNTGQFPVLLVYGFLGIVLLLIFIAITRFFRSRGKADLPDANARQDTEEDELPAQRDLHALRAKALSQADWASAYRWSFLLLLADLSRQAWINWTRDGTNRRYAQELMALGEPGFVQDFRFLGIAFERIRYGQGTMDQAGFEALDQSLSAFQERAEKLARLKQSVA